MRFFLLVTFFVFSAGSLQATDNKTPQFLNAAPKKVQPFTRIVSLAPVITETLFALGVGDRLVGVTRFCDRPAQASKIPKVGGFVDGSLERILGLKPDLVVAMPQQAQRGLLKNIQEHGVPVYLVFGDTISEIKQLIHGLGTLLKKKESRPSHQKASDLLRRLSRYSGQASRLYRCRGGCETAGTCWAQDIYSRKSCSHGLNPIASKRRTALAGLVIGAFGGHPTRLGFISVPGGRCD